MSDGLTFDVPNLSDWLGEFQRLPEVMQRRVVRGAVATGCSVIRVEAKARAPEWTGDVSKGHPPPGTLKKAIYQVRLMSECTPTLEAWQVSVRSGKKGKVDAFYAKWVEYGHYTRPVTAIKGNRKSRRDIGLLTGQVHWVPAQPFMRPAFEAKQGDALKAMENYFAENVGLATASFRYIKAIS